MQSLKFIHTADIHLDSPLRGLEAHDDAPLAEIRGATRRAFEALIDLAIDEAVAFILIAGDLFDGDWKDYNTGLYFAGRMGRLAKAGIKVFIIAGNHDAASQITKTLPWPENVFVFQARQADSARLAELGIVIHGQSYATRAVTGNLVAQYPEREPGVFNIGLLHTSLTGREGHEAYAPCTVAELQGKGYDYWALGHVHRREIVASEPWIVFPGNLQGRHIKEEGSKGATLVRVEDGRVVEVQERPLDVLRWTLCRVDLSDCDSMEGVYLAVRQGFIRERDRADGRALALRLVLTGDCQVHGRLLARTAELTAEFRGIAVGLGDIWLEQVRFATRRKAELAEYLDGDSPLAVLLKEVQRLELGGGSLLSIVPELAVLKSKLPAEVGSDDDSFFQPSQEKLAELTNEVRELLIARLLLQGDGL
ncbi:MAG: DNA repair exonuclease [Desulforhopalus sp.]|nr:DNA repair exonuclease [Desulforhopalus sp.]